MKSQTPKVLHEVCGLPILGHVLSTVKEVKPQQSLVVIGHQKELVKQYINSEYPKVQTVVQTKQLGTGHAVQTALASLKSVKGLVLVLASDTPLLSSQTLNQLVKAAKTSKAAVLTADFPDPTGYGRIIKDEDKVLRIVEHKDASSEELEISEINTGVYVFDADLLKQAVSTAVVCDNYLEALGINDQAQLAEVQRIKQQQINEHWMLQGVTMRNPETVIIDLTVSLASGVFLDTNTHLIGNTSVDSGSHIGPDSLIVDSKVGESTRVIKSTLDEAVVGNNCAVGPYTYLRPGTKLKDGVKAGAYVEIKNSMLVAPVKIGDGAYTAAGSVITENVPAGALGVERTKQRNIDGWTIRKRPNSPYSKSVKKGTKKTKTKTKAKVTKPAKKKTKNAKKQTPPKKKKK
ncbi:MAG: bifunctional N-acetylglucosamine-1-phosphate uridyltransferase/glucosamine-1-phosphate acetyltransferase [Actinobacteria bacterium]|nr:bifunctional N-acetylglucosamine-1-phosphate uridyltransferase/glucosamine-1-phosphate acetyltransferase [Actinomycetota bacterium]